MMTIEDELSAYQASAQRTVLTFVGYSGAGYEDEAAMLAAARLILANKDASRVTVNVGATAAGIGRVYELAKQMGFATMGIVSTQARDGAVKLSPWVDRVFFVPDPSWGGLDGATGELSPTSQVIVQYSDEFVGIGGGDIARDELVAALQAGKPVTFVPADMHHQTALDRARSRGEVAPVDFRGTAHDALGPRTRAGMMDRYTG